jgi:hypothetical protein
MGELSLRVRVLVVVAAAAVGLVTSPVWHPQHENDRARSEVEVLIANIGDLPVAPLGTKPRPEGEVRCIRVTPSGPCIRWCRKLIEEKTSPCDHRRKATPRYHRVDRLP